MEVVLIQPNYRKIYIYAGSEEATPIFPPFGLAYIAAVLRKNRIPVKIIEANALNLTYEQIARILEKEGGLKYIGITATTCLIEEAGKIAKICPKNAKIVVGGIHPTAMPEEVLKDYQDIDIVVRGEGEFTMVELAKNIPLEKIKGIAYRNKKGKIILNPPRPAIENLDKLPFPARDLLPMSKYKSVGTRKRPADYILSSRGCPYSCIFCADHLVHGKKFRMRSPGNVLEEIEHLIRKGVKEFDFIDDNFTLDIDRAEKICNLMIKKGLNRKIIWRCSNGIRIDRVTYDLLKKMKKAGCYMVALGIESGNEEILKNIKKGIKLEDVEKVVKWCKKVGFETRGLFMFGNLGEDEKTMNDTIKFAKKLDTDTVSLHITIPFPKTEYWEIIKGEGELFPKKWTDYVAYGKPVFRHEKVTPELMIKMQKKAFRAFYFRPSKIIKTLLRMRSLNQLKGYLQAGTGLLKKLLKK